MNVTVSTPATKDPILLGEAKEHLQVEHTRDDRYIRSLIRAATTWAESFMGRKVINQTLTVLFDGNEVAGRFQLPYSPVSSVTSFKVFNTDGTEETVSTDYYYLSGDSPGHIVPQDGGWQIYRPWKAAEIVYVAGYGNSGLSVPDDIIHAIKMIVADLYHNTESAKLETRTQLNPNEVPFSARVMLEPYRIFTY